MDIRGLLLANSEHIAEGSQADAPTDNSGCGGKKARSSAWLSGLQQFGIFVC